MFLPRKRWSSLWLSGLLTTAVAVTVGSLAIPERAVADPSNPSAGARVTAVTVAGANRFAIAGVALDQNGDAACALALASGRCMFTCGPGSPRCEGGTADLPRGQFALSDLAAEPNGTIRLQVFIREHISHTEIIRP